VDIAVSIGLLVGGLALALVASDVAVSYTRALAALLGAPPFVVGVVLVALGTDLPEIANSIASHLQGEGDVNVGDSIGSTLTQYTFVLGLFPLVIAVIAVTRLQVGLVSVLTVGGLLLTTLVVLDGSLGRVDGLLLVLAWAVAMLLVTRLLPSTPPEEPPAVRFQGRASQAGVVMAALAVVGVGATVAVRSLVALSEEIGVPEFLLAFFGASLGTSAPEIAVDFTALRQGAPAIALGDVLGSSLIDSTLSIGIGPIVEPAPVTTRLAVTASLYTAAAVVVVAIVLMLRRRHDRLSMPVLLALYGLSYVVLLAAD
jgi:cation:H+ antiporter